MTARWIPVLLMAAMSVPGWGQAQDRFALTARQVARALSESGIQTEDEQVSLLARVVATKPDPILDVLSVETLGAQPRSRVKLVCRMPAECLPFYAIVSRPPGTLALPTSASTGVRNAALYAKVDITMRAGTHATLMMDDNRSHIQVAVISLENGMAGHRIRVASPDHKQVYYGEVVNASLLRGSF